MKITITLRLLLLHFVLLMPAICAAQKPELIAQTGHTGFGGLKSIAFSPDGKVIASLGMDHTIKLWSVDDGYELRTIILTGRVSNNVPHDVTGLDFSPDGKTLVAGGSDGTIWLTDVASGRELVRLNITQEKTYANEIKSVHFSPDGKTVVSVYSSFFSLWNVEDSKGIRWLKNFDNELTESVGVLFAPSGKLLASDSLGDIILWDVESAVSSAREARRLKGDTDYRVALAFSADGKFIAGGNRDGLISVWDVATGQRIQDFKAHIGAKDINAYSLAVAFSPDGGTLVSATPSGLVKIWDLKTGKEISQSKLNASKINSVRFSRNGNLLAAVSGTAIRVFEAGTGSDVSTLGTHLTDLVFFASFSSDAEEIAQQGLDTTIKVLNVETGQIKILPWPEFGAIYRLSEEPVSADVRRRIRLGENNKLNIFDEKPVNC